MSADTKPIVLRLSTGLAGAMSFRADSVDGKGIDKEKFEASAVVARFRYSRTAPGVVVLHFLNVRYEGPWSTPLKHLKFWHHKWLPATATPDVLRRRIVETLSYFDNVVSNAKIDADVNYLLHPLTLREIAMAYRDFDAE